MSLNVATLLHETARKNPDHPALAAGAVVVPLNVLLTADEVAYDLNDSDSVVIVAWEGFFEPAKAGFNRAESCHHLIVAKADATDVSAPEAVADAVVGVSDEVHGEEDKAIVALKPGTEATEDALITYCKEHLAAYKYPRSFEFRGELPKGPTGKILKRELE